MDGGWFNKPAKTGVTEGSSARPSVWTPAQATSSRPSSTPAAGFAEGNGWSVAKGVTAGSDGTDEDGPPNPVGLGSVEPDGAFDAVGMPGGWLEGAGVATQ